MDAILFCLVSAVLTSRHGGAGGGTATAGGGAVKLKKTLGITTRTAVGVLAGFLGITNIRRRHRRRRRRILALPQLQPSAAHGGGSVKTNTGRLKMVVVVEKRGRRRHHEHAHIRGNSMVNLLLHLPSGRGAPHPNMGCCSSGGGATVHGGVGGCIKT